MTACLPYLFNNQVDAVLINPAENLSAADC
jgi:hypothetical protein